MNTRIEIMNFHQDAALESWQKNNYVGTLFMSVGAGKTFCFLKSLYLLLDKGLLNKGDTVRFFAETVVRKITLFQDEIPKFEDIYDKNPVNDFNIEFLCYQARVKKSKAEFDCYDEVDVSATKRYHKHILKSTASYKLGLTSSINATSIVFKDKVHEALHDQVYQSDEDTRKKLITDYITKGQLLEVLLPTVYDYPFEQAIKDGVLSPIETYIIQHPLNAKRRYLKAFKNSKFYSTEKQQYTYLDDQRQDFSKPVAYRSKMARLAVNMLYDLKSKAHIYKFLKKHLKGKTLIFGIRKKLLRSVTDNVLDSDNFEELLTKFGNDEITEIASSMLIRRGLSVYKTENAVFMSYYSTWDDFLQKAARIARYEEGKTTKLFVFVTQDTFEEDWIKSISQVKNYKGEVIKEIDLNIKQVIYSPMILMKNFKLEL